MRIHIGTDHAGFEFKEILVAHLASIGHEIIDHGALTFDALDNYPAYCFAAAQATVDDPGSLGVVIGGSGNGEQISANKVAGTRVALAWNIEVAQLARQHNDANIVSIGARQHATEEALAIVDAFVAEPFSQDERHQRRIDAIAAYEATR